MGVGKFVRSGPFSVGGHNWAIRFYPDGEIQASQDFITVYLELLSKGAVAHASCDLRLIDQATGLPSSAVNRTAPRLFNQNDRSRFAPENCRFAMRSELESSANLCGDQLSIECIVTVIKDPQVSQTRSSSKIGVPPQSDIVAHLGKLLEAKDTTDVTFCVGEDQETFAAHKAILTMQSPVFRAELFGPMRKMRKEVISIEDM
ncbi:hypothetical protein E2562_032063 [Oryza meyeriana var. granulata]|uniref:BTB domain-containing protein n=1 Tax=Oryza meyeriana var. granulata TaxID=110450 RepID=A0A6G1CII7_9ORYZ|nr:hypothetical protein E2562_032063 [Oryza meyeriana var. granulata]